MRGRIEYIDWKKGMVTVQTEIGKSLFEILSDDNFDVGDEVIWNEHNPLGDCEIHNLTKEENADVYFQNH